MNINVIDGRLQFHNFTTSLTNMNDSYRLVSVGILSVVCLFAFLLLNFF